MKTLIIEWHDCSPDEDGGTKLSAKVGKNAAPFFEQRYPKGQLEQARDKAVELLEKALPEFADVEAQPRSSV